MVRWGGHAALSIVVGAHAPNPAPRYAGIALGRRVVHQPPYGGPRGCRDTGMGRPLLRLPCAHRALGERSWMGENRGGGCVYRRIGRIRADGSPDRTSHRSRSRPGGPHWHSGDRRRVDQRARDGGVPGWVLRCLGPDWVLSGGLSLRTVLRLSDPLVARWSTPGDHAHHPHCRLCGHRLLSHGEHHCRRVQLAGRRSRSVPSSSWLRFRSSFSGHPRALGRGRPRAIRFGTRRQCAARYAERPSGYSRSLFRWWA